MTACATRPPTQTGFLNDYATMEAAPDTVRAQITQRRDPAVASAIARVRIAPPVLAPGVVLDPAISPDELALVTMELERRLCFELSRRYAIGGAEDADAARIEVAVSDIGRTSAGASLVSAVASRAIPGPGSVRLPVGRGSLIVEARAVDGQGREGAAMVWSRGAGLAFDRGSLSEVGDAHRYSGAFAEDFTQWLAGSERPEGQVPDPDPCRTYGPRIDLLREAARFGTGLHVVGQPATGTNPQD
ncbi:MAG: DUF3313 domain-containing protein [Hyphomonadaceae bacterium]|nr:DUF3313 domain-containing protein [Hyphomonadaceae bacterium]